MNMTSTLFPVKGRYFYLEERQTMDEIKDEVLEPTSDEPADEESSDTDEEEKMDEGQDL